MLTLWSVISNNADYMLALWSVISNNADYMLALWSMIILFDYSRCHIKGLSNVTQKSASGDLLKNLIKWII